jgi:hypothetical protein
VIARRLKVPPPICQAAPCGGHPLGLCLGLSYSECSPSPRMPRRTRIATPGAEACCMLPVAALPPVSHYIPRYPARRRRPCLAGTAAGGRRARCSRRRSGQYRRGQPSFRCSHPGEDLTLQRHGACWPERAATRGWTRTCTPRFGPPAPGPTAATRGPSPSQ